jgi:hypothetical protein
MMSPRSERLLRPAPSRFMAALAISLTVALAVIAVWPLFHAGVS